VYEYGWGEARKFAQRIASAFSIGLGVAAFLSVAVVAAPAEAKKKQKPIEKPAEMVLDPANGEPLTLVVSLNDQQIDVYRGLTLITSSKVSTGTPQYPTKAGVFSILEKQRYHHSNMYSAAPMPWMQRLTWSGTALHGGVVPGYPASHGCIRLRFSFAPKLYGLTTGGENVIVGDARPAPRSIEHPTLFQPPKGSVVNELPRSDTVIEGAQDVIDPSVSSDEQGPDVSVAPEATTKSLSGSSEAATTPSLTPLRILVTRRTERDRIIGVQYLLSSMGYLAPQKFSGRLGDATVAAIKAFQKANGMLETGAFSDSLAKKIYEVAAKDEPPAGHLFVRQDFKPLFDAPIAFRNPEQTLGTHVFTAIFAPGDTNAKWLAVSLEGDDAMSALDRLEIPDDIRERISERLTPGSSLIIGDQSLDSAILPEGADFIVLAKSTFVVASANDKVQHARSGRPKAKITKTGRPKAKITPRWDRSLGGYPTAAFRGFDRPRSFYRWRWRR